MSHFGSAPDLGCFEYTTVIPSVGTAVAASVAPSVIFGAVSITSNAATQAAAVPPGVAIEGPFGIKVTPPTAMARAGAVPPSVSASALLEPGPAEILAVPVAPSVTLGAVSIDGLYAAVEAAVGDPFDIFPDQAVVEAAVDGVCTVAWPPTDASAAEAVAITPSINLGNILVNRPIAAVEAGFSPPIVTWAWPDIDAAPIEAAVVAPAVLFGATGVEPGVACIEDAAVVPDVAYGNTVVSPAVAAAEADIRAHEQEPPWIAEGQSGAFSIMTGAA